MGYLALCRIEHSCLPGGPGGSRGRPARRTPHRTQSPARTAGLRVALRRTVPHRHRRAARTYSRAARRNLLAARLRRSPSGERAIHRASGARDVGCRPATGRPCKRMRHRPRPPIVTQPPPVTGRMYSSGLWQHFGNSHTVRYVRSVRGTRPNRQSGTPADAYDAVVHGSGPCLGNQVEVRVLSSAPRKGLQMSWSMWDWCGVLPGRWAATVRDSAYTVGGAAVSLGRGDPYERTRS
jgi:hypothetical protein